MIVIYRLWVPMMLWLTTWDVTWFIVCHKCVGCGNYFMPLM